MAVDPTSHRIAAVVCQLLQLPSTDASKGDSGQDTLLVRIRTTSGLEGIGEVEGSSSVAMAVIDAPTVWYKASGLRALLLGKDPLDTEVLWRTMCESGCWLAGWPRTNQHALPLASRRHCCACFSTSCPRSQRHATSLTLPGSLTLHTHAAQSAGLVCCVRVYCRRPFGVLRPPCGGDPGDGGH